MPLYEYRCSACGAITEVIQAIADEPLTVCESCGGELKKQISSPAFQFKGSGWYVSDYGKGSSPGPEKGKDAAGDGTKDAPKADGAKGDGGSPDAGGAKGSSAKGSDGPPAAGSASSAKDGGKSSG